MKSFKSLTIAFALIFLAIGLYGNKSIAEEEHSSNQTSVDIEYTSETLVDWLLTQQACEDIYTTCCCNGDITICEIPGSVFICWPGGSFGCDPELGECGENPANCIMCCTQPCA